MARSHRDGFLKSCLMKMSKIWLENNSVFDSFLRHCKKDLIFLGDCFIAQDRKGATQSFKNEDIEFLINTMCETS